MKINIIGAGLAGCEAAYQLAKRGYQIDLYEMRPKVMTPAHKTANFAELVCSNSFRSNSLENAVGILKEELRMLDSIIMKIADENQVSAGGSLAVSREDFSTKVTEFIKNEPNINIVYEEVDSILEGYTIICTGPLTSDKLSKAIIEKTGVEDFYFFDAAAPIIEKDSIDFSKAYFKSRYDKGEADYINCPMNKEQFMEFYNFLINAPCVVPKDFELKVFEGCMPVEEIARRGEQTLTFGPMKPVGLNYEDQRFYAVVQLRQDNKEGTLYNIVGFQTHLTWSAQKELMKYIPGLENAVIARYGVMHKNHYLNAPKLLDNTYRLIGSDLFFGGQITGVEGYVESVASGMCAALNLDAMIKNKPRVIFGPETAIGSLAHYISTAPAKSFQPMNATFGLLKELDFKHKKKERKGLYASRALKVMEEKIGNL